ncbi:MAG: glutathione peroxidase [Pseudomonadota bacterium]
MLFDLLSMGAQRTYDLDSQDKVVGTFTLNNGKQVSLEDWRGHPVLVVNTATLCGFASQYRGIQNLHEAYKDRGLYVLAVSSNDFLQERKDAEAVKKYCETTFGLTYPMTEITHVLGSNAHSFYRDLKNHLAFTPTWNFNKVLIDTEGRVAASWGVNTSPESRNVKRAIEKILSASGAG